MTSTEIIDDSDTETQSSFSGSDEMDDDNAAFPLAGETQILDFDEDTQILECFDNTDDDDQYVRTQLLDDDDDECSDETQVLTDVDDDGYVVDSDVPSDTYDTPPALLRASGQSSYKMTHYEKSCVSNNSQCAERHLDKDDGTNSLKDPVSVVLEVTKAGLHNNMQSCDMRMEVRTDITEPLIMDKPFDEDTSFENDETIKKSVCYEGPWEEAESPAYDHQFAVLSYVGSEEPGEFSQVNALNVVDKYLAINHVEFSQEEGCAKSLNGLSPLVSRPKGTQILARSSGIKSSVIDVAIYDWVDTSEDGGCRDNSTNMRSGCCEQRSLSQPPKSRYLDRKEGTPANKSGEGSVNLLQKLRHSTCLDTRVLCHSKPDANMVPTSEVHFVKKLSSALDEKLNTKSLENSLEGIGRMDLPEVYDIGFDTQMAAEAMEALCQADPPDQGTGNSCEVSEKVNRGYPRVVTTGEALTKRVYVRKRVSLDTVTNASRSKRRRKLVKKVDYVNSDLSAEGLKDLQRKEQKQVSLVTRKPRTVKSKARAPQAKEISFDGENDKCPRPSKSDQSRKTRGALEKLHNTDSIRIHLSNNNLEVSEGRIQDDFGYFTPIACRTRRSKAAKPLTGSVLNSCNVANGKAGNTLSMNKTRGYRSGINAPALGKQHNSDSCQIAKIGKKEPKQLELPGIGKLLEETTKNEKSDVQSYPKVKRKCQHILKGSHLDGASNLASGQSIHEQHIPRRKRSKNGGRGLSRAKPSTVWGIKFDPNVYFCTSDLKSNDMSEVTAKDKSGSSSSFTINNQTNGTEAPSHICLADDPPIIESRKTRVLADVRLLLSHHLDDTIIKQQQKISSRLGLAVVSSSSEATHFIADKFVRTRNMLEAITFGKPVVTHFWLESCRKANSFVDETNYILRDIEKEKEFGFSMPVSLARARACNSRLLQGKRIFVTPNVKPSKELVASLATAVHGQVVKRIGRSEMNGDNISEDLLVLSCEEDYAACLPLLLKRAAVYSSELILHGIIIQNLEYERHRLFGDHVTRTECVKRTLHG